MSPDLIDVLNSPSFSISSFLSFLERQTPHMFTSFFTSSAFSFPFGHCMGSSSGDSQLGAKVLPDSSMRISLEDRMGGDVL